MESKLIVWEGDSLDVLRAFPMAVKVNLGHELRRLQEGLIPIDSKPMKSIESGVYELRERDSQGQYRVLYYTKFNQVIYVLNCFIKKTSKTPNFELKKAKQRLNNLKKRLRSGEIL